MILEMYMKNCALIEESRLTINSGLNILTGETGAGKSIIIEALGLRELIKGFVKYLFHQKVQILKKS